MAKRSKNATGPAEQASFVHADRLGGDAEAHPQGKRRLEGGTNADAFDKKTTSVTDLEDRHWAEEGRKVLEEFDRSGRKPIPWESIKERLGL